MTRRDLQDEAKRLSRPWEGGKGFDRSAPMSPIHPVSAIGHPDDKPNLVECERRGTAGVDDVPHALECVRIDCDLVQVFRTCTQVTLFSQARRPGVGLVERGDRIRGGVDGVAEIDVTVI